MSPSSPPTASAQLARLLTLVPWLLQNPGVSAEAAGREFGVSASQIERDLNLLIVCGLPGGQPGDLIDIQFWADDDEDIEIGRSDDGTDDGSDDGRVRADGPIRVLQAQGLDRPMALRPDEVVPLLLGVRLLQDLPGGPGAEVLTRVAAALEDVAGAAAQQAGVVQVDPPTPDLTSHVRAAIDDALARGRRLRIDYLVPSRDEVTTRDVEPAEVVVSHGQAYLRAWCLRADAERTFRLDRILAAEALDDPVDHDRPLGDTDPSSVAAVEPGERAVLRLAARGRWVLEQAPVVSVAEEPDGGCTAVLGVADLRWAERLVLAAGPHARVVEPPALAEAVDRRARAALAAYSGASG